MFFCCLAILANHHHYEPAGCRWHRKNCFWLNSVLQAGLNPEPIRYFLSAAIQAAKSNRAACLPVQGGHLEPAMLAASHIRLHFSVQACSLAQTSKPLCYEPPDKAARAAFTPPPAPDPDPRSGRRYARCRSTDAACLPIRLPSSVLPDSADDAWSMPGGLPAISRHRY